MTAAPGALSIDPRAIAANVRACSAATSGEIMAVVKADGFGHGAALVAGTALAAGATRLGVAHLGEALALRSAGVDAPILSWLNPPGADFGAAIAADIDIAVASVEVLRAVAGSAATERPARVHLHVDCGMARDGAPVGAWPGLCAEAVRWQRAGRLRIAGIMGHLATAEEPGNPWNKRGIDRFTWACEVSRSCGARPRDLHLAATAATLAIKESQFTMSRIGAGLVGIDPSGTTSLRVAMTLRAPVVSVRRVDIGTAVGYGHTWRAGRATRLALIPLGYADGIPRAASGRAEVHLSGHRCPVVGRISMDQLVVDVGRLPVAPGDTAVLFGPGDHGEPTPRDWARWAGTITHEIVTGLGPRIRRSTHASPAPTPTSVRTP